MLSPLVLDGYCTIRLYKKVGGSNAQPHTIIWEVCGNTLIDECNFLAFDQHRWLMVWDSSVRSYYVRRGDRDNQGKRLNVMMAREVLGLPRTPGMGGDQADHKHHDTLDNTKDGLRVATSVQSVRNRGKWGSSCRFKGIWKNKSRFETAVRYNGKRFSLGTFNTDVEAALAYFYAGDYLYGGYFHGSVIPDSEMPSEERQEYLWQRVFKKLSDLGLFLGD